MISRRESQNPKTAGLPLFFYKSNLAVNCTIHPSICIAQRNISPLLVMNKGAFGELKNYNGVSLRRAYPISHYIDTREKGVVRKWV